MSSDSVNPKIQKASQSGSTNRYPQERYQPNLPHCGRLRLEFDSRQLRLLTGTQTFSYAAVSGRPLRNGTFDYSVPRQKIRDIGPIPVGIYWIRLDELWENAWYRFTSSTSAWGNFRISIHPFPTTQTYGRGGFFIHGGSIPGSAGCIDLTNRMDSFVNDLRRESGGLEECQIHLSVQY